MPSPVFLGAKPETVTEPDGFLGVSKWFPTAGALFTYGPGRASSHSNNTWRSSRYSSEIIRYY